jgi:hypothetical protein
MEKEEAQWRGDIARRLEEEVEQRGNARRRLEEVEQRGDAHKRMRMGRGREDKAQSFF